MAAGLDAIIDVSHHNKVNFLQVRKAGVLAVIHKATQGLGFLDPTYQDDRARALTAGLLWGAYHFGVAGDGAGQADYFLDAIGGSPTLIVLDFEANPQGPSMNLQDARDFVTRVSDRTGRYPGFYSGQYVKEQLGAQRDEILSHCWFWLAQWGPTAVVPPTWSNWQIWQYSDGAHGTPPPQPLPGAGRVDRDRFNGKTEAALRSFWASQT